MNADERLNRYFDEQSRAIDLAPGDPARIVARAVRRHRVRRGAAALVTAAVLVVGAAVVFTGDTPGQDLRVAGSTGSRTALAWTPVEVPVSLGWSNDTVATEDGSLYDLSTAPGPAEPDNDGLAPATLYRSADGQQWDPVGVPDGVSATDLATSGGSLYAVGTAPAGGAIDLVMLASDDGGASWAQGRIPMPRADLEARFGREVTLSPPVIASGPDGLVAAVTVTAFPDVQAMLPAGELDTSGGWQTSATGVDIFEPYDGREDQERKEPVVARSYTWDELGLDPDLRPIIEGEIHLYRSADGASFEEISSPAVDGGYLGGLVGGDDGYRLLVGSGALLRQVFSADGRSWASSGPDLEGWVQTSGRLPGGAPAVVLGTPTGASLLQAAAGGGWTSSDLLAAIGADRDLGLQAVAIGPLGVVAALAGDGSDVVIAESGDGVVFNRAPLSELAGDGKWMVAGIAMNADAATIRMLPWPKDGEQPGETASRPQRLLVGIPS